MKFLKSIRPAAAAVGLITAGLPKDLKISDATSVKSVAMTIAEGAMSYYQGGPDKFVDLPAPHYWWQAGALFGAMLDYSHYTNDHTYDETIATALLAQVGPKFDYMLPSHFGQEGNDDQAFWGFAVTSAAERNFPQPDESIPSWLEMSQNIFEALAGRWNTSACGGGLLWQIFPDNPNGLNYKNTVSNGGFFQIAARLARITGEKKYADWAEKVWDWTENIGMINEQGHVFDGAHADKDCKDTNPVSFSYSAGIYAYGAAVMADHTGDKKWVERTSRVVEGSRWFFENIPGYPNATNIMYEHACEHVDKCNTDMRSFKGYMSRFFYASAVLVPEVRDTVDEFLQTSAKAAANACTGGTDGTTCGQKWYVGGFDGKVGLGEEMCALETIQGLLARDSPKPLKKAQIKTVRTFST